MQDGTPGKGFSSAAEDSANVVFPSQAGAQEQSQDTISGKFTLTMDCTALLKPNPDDNAMFMSKTVDESVQKFRLHSVIQLQIVDRVKVKLFHTCGLIEFDNAACMHALWDMSDWIAAQYQNNGRRVDVEKKGDGRGRDWAEPDAYFVITLD